MVRVSGLVEEDEDEDMVGGWWWVLVLGVGEVGVASRCSVYLGGVVLWRSDG